MRTSLSRNELLTRKSAEQTGDNSWTPAEVVAQLAELPGWALQDGAIERSYAFRDYYETIAFVNALAWVIHGENHHPDLLVGYNRCTVRFSTHSVGGISENDFICAAKTDAVHDRSTG